MKEIQHGDTAWTVKGVADLAWALTAKDCDYHLFTSNRITFEPGNYRIVAFLSSSAQGGFLGSGNVIRFGQSHYIALNEQTGKSNSNNGNNPYFDLQFITKSKIDVIITNVENQYINKSYSEIPYATYVETDIDNDSELNDYIIIPNPINGEYEISVTPEPDADPDDTFSIMYTIDGSDFVYIAENVKISDIPTEPYTINIVSDNLPLVEVTYPTDFKELSDISIIRWYAHDNEQEENLSMSFYYSDDDGDNWYLLNDNPVDNNGVFFWDTTMVPDGKYILKVETVDNDGNIGYDTSEDFMINNRNGTSPENEPPLKPSTPIGQTNGKVGIEYTYSSDANDNEMDPIYYLFNWGDGTNSMIGPLESGETAETSHFWERKGTYEIKVRGIDVYGYKSDWSDSLSVTIPRDKYVNSNFNLFNWLFSRFPYIYPLLQKLLVRFGL